MIILRFVEWSECYSIVPPLTRYVHTRCRTPWRQSATTTTTTAPQGFSLPPLSAMSWAPRCSFVLVLVLFLVLFLVLVLVLVLPESFKNFSLQNLGEILSEREAIAEAMHHR